MQLPSDFIRLISEILGNETEKFLAACNEELPVSVRLNNKLSLSPNYKKVDGTCNGYYLPKRPSFTLDPLFHCGAYYVQEASSMYLETFYNKYVSKKVAILDLCAAPGGKSTHVASLMEEGSLLVSNEYVPQRASILVENMTKWGVTNTIVTNNTPADFGKRLSGFFDVMITDVPCSGEGMFRKEPVAIEDWSLDAVAMCAERQRSILSDSWGALKDNGILFYSTCTFNRSEDEENVSWICEELGGELLESKHFYFHDGVGEGFFIAAIRKQCATSEVKIKDIKPLKKHTLLDALDSDNGLVMHNESLCAIGRDWVKVATYMSGSFNVLKLGTRLFTLKGRDEVPDVALALDKKLIVSRFNCIDVDLKSALSFLKCEALMVSAPKGYSVIRYREVPLGFVKSLGNRCNNLYPQYWRIRMNIPSEIDLCELPF